MMPPKKRRATHCLNPACNPGEPRGRFLPRGHGSNPLKETCDSSCRAERSRLSKAGITTREQFEAHSGAQDEPQTRAKTARGRRRRKDTLYTVFEVVGPGLVPLRDVEEHGPEEAVRQVAGRVNGKKYVAIPETNLHQRQGDGSRAGRVR